MSYHRHTLLTKLACAALGLTLGLWVIAVSAFAIYSYQLDSRDRWCPIVFKNFPEESEFIDANERQLSAQHVRSSR